MASDDAMEEHILTEAIVGAKASNAAETATICMVSDPISDSILNLSIPQLETKTPTPYTSPTQSYEHIPSP